MLNSYPSRYTPIILILHTIIQKNNLDYNPFEQILPQDVLKIKHFNKNLLFT